MSYDRTDPNTQLRFIFRVHGRIRRGYPPSRVVGPWIFEYCTVAMLARQVDYDALYSELISSGSAPGEAALETYETFISEDYDLSSIFAYQTEEERELKDTLLSKFQVVKSAADRRDTFVNASFAISSIRKILSMGIMGAWRLLETMKFLDSLFKLLGPEDEGSDEDEEDDDEHRVLQLTTVLQAINYFINEGISGQRFRDSDSLLVLPEEHWTIIIQAMDEEVQSKDVLVQFSDLLTTLLAYPANVEAFHTCHGDDLLDLAKKMYKNNEQVKQILSRIQNML